MRDPLPLQGRADRGAFQVKVIARAILPIWKPCEGVDTNARTALPAHIPTDPMTGKDEWACARCRHPNPIPGEQNVFDVYTKSEGTAWTERNINVVVGRTAFGTDRIIYRGPMKRRFNSALYAYRTDGGDQHHRHSMSLAIPNYTSSILMQGDCAARRSLHPAVAHHQYTLDKQKGATRWLEHSHGRLLRASKDPFTNARDSWVRSPDERSCRPTRPTPES